MALINRYQGNSGRVTRYNEPGERQRAQQSERQRAQQSERQRAQQSERRRAQSSGTMAGRPMPPQQQQTQSVLGGLNDLGRLLPEKIGELEVEDLILLLILYLMYRESGDSDLLIIMGAMFLL